MPTLADMLSARSPAYGAARRKYGLSPDMLVTPPGLMRGASPPIDRNRAAAAYNAYAPRQLGREELSAGASPSLVRAMFGDNGARTVPLAGNLKPPAPLPAPLSDPQEAAEFASRWNARPGGRSVAIPKPGGGVQMRGLWSDSGGGVQPGQLDTAAFIERNPHLASQFTGKGTRALAQGMKNLPETDASRRRSAYLLNQRVDQMMRRGGPQAAALAEALGIEDRLPGVVDNAAARAAARRQRLADRQRVPSPLEQMAMRNPALALQLMGLQQRGQIAQGELALRKALGLGQLDVAKGDLELRRGTANLPLDIAKEQGRASDYRADKGAEAAKSRTAAADRQLRIEVLLDQLKDPSLSATERERARTELMGMVELPTVQPSPGTAPAPSQSPAAPAATAPPSSVTGGVSSPALATAVSPRTKPRFTSANEQDIQQYVDNNDAVGLKNFLRDQMGLSGPQLNAELNRRMNIVGNNWLPTIARLFPTRTEENPEGSWFGPGFGTQVDYEGNVSPSLTGRALNAMFGTEYGLPPRRPAVKPPPQPSSILTLLRSMF